MDAAEKQEKLFEALKSMDSCMVAFSGGLDSTYLLWAANRILGDRTAAITLASPYTPAWEVGEARQTAKQMGVSYFLVVIPHVPEEIRFNPEDRCYRCKKRLFAYILAEAEARGLRHVADGTNADDAGDHRPGIRALRELHVRSPLQEAGLTKEEIRTLTRAAGLGAWQKAPCACLLTRLPHGREITAAELTRIDCAEQYLHALGFPAVRVRSHGELARIELPGQEGKRIFSEDLAEEIARNLQELGYRYVALELSGYRMGSMNAPPDTR
jgi:pyridinium-3,5-biscarboxylic acid mononucleotide sulfurtransferase